MIPVERLRAHHANVRSDLGDLTELAASIRAVGLLQPLVVTPVADGMYEVVDGNRRLAAAVQAGAKALPCLAAKAQGEDGQLAIMLAAALHQALAPLDQAQAFAALRSRGLTVTEISRRTGYSPRTVSGRLLLLGLPDEARDMVRTGELTVTDAEELARQVRDTKTGTTRTAGPRAPWFTTSHPLARAAAAVCDHQDTRRLLGPACGQCWEQQIRTDALGGGS